MKTDDPTTEYAKTQKYRKYARRKIGLYLVSYNSQEFSDWKLGLDVKSDCTFLPEKSNPSFNEKWGYLTDEDQVMCLEEAREKNGENGTRKEIRKRKQEAEQEKIREKLRLVYNKYMNETRLKETYEYWKNVLEKLNIDFDEEMDNAKNKLNPDNLNIRSWNDYKMYNSIYECYCIKGHQLLGFGKIVYKYRLKRGK